MDVHEAIYGRRSVRDYRPAAPSHDLLRQVIADAVQAPNSMDRQAWSFIVVEGAEMLADCALEAKAEALKALPATAPPELREMVENPGFNVFYNAPALVVICADYPDAMLAEDCCLAAQTLMLSAYAHGLGTCPIGFADPWLKTPEAHAKLQIRSPREPVMAIIIGEPASQPKPPGRRQPEIAWLADHAHLPAAPALV